MHLRLLISFVYGVTMHMEATTKQVSQESHQQTLLVEYTYKFKLSKC